MGEEMLLLEASKCVSKLFKDALNMNARTFTSVQENLEHVMDRVCDDHLPLIITRQNERPVVLMSLEDYRSLEETAYLLRSPNNAKRLLESIAELESGKGIVRELVE